jgi:hypothetical protein
VTGVGAPPVRWTSPPSEEAPAEAARRATRQPVTCDVRVRYTEKTLKAILSGSPFLMYAAPGTLALLRGQGFRTFAPHINETYDTLSSNAERVAAVVNEAKRILAMSDDDFEGFMVELDRVADFNRRWLLSDEFFDLVSKQALYAFGLAGPPAFPGSDEGFAAVQGSSLMDDLLASTQPKCLR